MVCLVAIDWSVCMVIESLNGEWRSLRDISFLANEKSIDKFSTNIDIKYSNDSFCEIRLNELSGN